SPSLERELEGAPALARRPVAGTGASGGPAPSPLATSAPARALEGVVHGGEGDLQLLRQRGGALAALDLLPEVSRLLDRELEGAPALARRPIAGTSASGRPAPSPLATSAPARALEGVVHGGKGDLQLLRQRG